MKLREMILTRRLAIPFPCLPFICNWFNQYLKTASTQIRGVSVDRELKMNNSGKKSKKKRHRQGSKKGSDDSGDKKSDDVSPMFDLSDCASYSDAWLFELAATCSDIDTLAGCECPTVFALLETGSVHCAGNLTSPYACPSDCKVCQVCLVASGCATIYAA